MSIVYYLTLKKPLSHNSKGFHREAQVFKDEFQSKFAKSYDSLPFPENEKLETDVLFIHRLNKGHIPDVDNLSKPLVDAFRGIIYIDDSQVIKRSSSILTFDELDLIEIDATNLPYEIYNDFHTYINSKTEKHVTLFTVKPFSPEKMVIGGDN